MVFESPRFLKIQGNDICFTFHGLPTFEEKIAKRPNGQLSIHDYTSILANLYSLNLETIVFSMLCLFLADFWIKYLSCSSMRYTSLTFFVPLTRRQDAFSLYDQYNNALKQKLLWPRVIKLLVDLNSSIIIECIAIWFICFRIMSRLIFQIDYRSFTYYKGIATSGSTRPVRAQIEIWEFFKKKC